MAWRISSAALILALVPLLLWTSEAVPKPASRDRLRSLIHRAPYEDVFTQLRQDEVAEWYYDEDLTLEQRLQHVARIEEQIYIDIKLVGFEAGDDFQIKESELGGYFDALFGQTLDPVYTLNAPEGDASRSHRLSIYKKYLRRIQRADKQLTASLRSAINKQLDAQISSIPYQVVDDIIQQDYNDQDISPGYTFYFLNLKPPKDTAYVYTEDENRRATGCPTAIWAGSKRYVWLDLRAGPMSYGPVTTGKGVVAEFSLPYMDNYLAFRHHPENLLIDLVAFIHRTCDFLISPALSRVPPAAAFNKNVTIHFITLTDRIVAANEATRRQSTNFAQIISEIEALPKQPGQRISFKQTEKSLTECLGCAAAYRYALKSHTSTVVTSTLHSQVHPYLDAELFHYWLGHFLPGIIDNVHDPQSTTVPIVLLDLSNYRQILLLDRYHQAVAFDDMAVAVQTAASSMVFDYACADESVAIDPRDATRALLAAVLDTVFAVAPTHVRWNPAAGDEEVDYLWSVGRTPFGLFSRQRRLSFSQNDAAARAPLYCELNSTLGLVQAMFEYFSDEFGSSELAAVLDDEEYTAFVARWNMFAWKVAEVQHFLSLLDFNTAALFVHSLKRDVEKFMEVVAAAGHRMHSYIVCKNAPQTSLSTVVVVVVSFVLCGGIVAYWMVSPARKAIRGAKRKLKSREKET